MNGLIHESAYVDGLIQESAYKDGFTVGETKDDDKITE